MKYTDLSPALKRKINTTYTKMVEKAFKPFFKKGVVHFGKLHDITPPKKPITDALCKEFKLTLNVLSSVLQGNDVFFNLKDKIVARRNAFFIKEHEKGNSVAELSQRYGLSKQIIEASLKNKPLSRIKSTSSFARVLDESFFSNKPEQYKKGESPPNKNTSKKTPASKPAFSFRETLKKMPNAKLKKGHNDYLKIKRKKLK
jgi:hypothetical protein